MDLGRRVELAPALQRDLSEALSWTMCAMRRNVTLRYTITGWRLASWGRIVSADIPEPMDI